MAYYPLTQEERERARTTDLAEYLRCCGEEIKRSGSEYQWLNAGRKVTLRGNLWFDQYEQVGGDAVEFLCHFYGMEYPNAVKTLVSMGIPQVTVPAQLFPCKTLEPPKKADSMRRVYAYLLRQRGIDKLKLFFEWGIRFDLPLNMEEHKHRQVCYASKEELLAAIHLKYPHTPIETPAPEMTPLEVHLQEQAKQPDGLITKTDK